MSDSEKDSMIVRDRSGRRQFIRRGAAFVAVGSIAAASPGVFASDCDQGVGGEKNAQAPGSDSDVGEGSDPTGCGRREPPKISQRQNSVDTDNNVRVKKVIV